MNTTPPHEGPSIRALTHLRARIEEADRELVELLARRCRLAEAIGARKREEGLPLADPAREARVVRCAAVEARSRGLDEEGVRQILWSVIGLARQVQDRNPENTP